MGRSAFSPPTGGAWFAALRVRRLAAVVCAAICAISNLGAGVGAAFAAPPALRLAQGADPSALQPEGCPRLLAAAPRPAPVALRRDELRLTFVGHATFLIETPAGLRVATDYNDYVKPQEPPHVATMNRAHATHFTLRPDPGIRHVLRGWNPEGGAAAHDVTIDDMRIRNVVTNIRDFAGGTERGANSIFVFEAAQICVAHLGHLHHPLEPQHIRELGRVDVVLAPVDGGYTMSTADMLQTIQSIGAQLVIPMHFFSQSTLQRFLDQARERFEIVRSDSPVVTLTRDSLPLRTQVLVLPGR